MADLTRQLATPLHGDGIALARWLRARVDGLHALLPERLRDSHASELARDPLVDAVSLITGEPRARAMTLLRQAERGNREFQRDYDDLAAATPRRLARHLQRIALPQADELDAVLGERTRPLIIALVHAGTFVSGLLRLLPQIPDTSEVVLVTRPAPSEREDVVRAHATRLGVPVRVLRLDERPLLPSLQALRDRAVVVVMCDVPPSFWRTAHVRQSLAETSLFGHPAWLPDGPAALAVAARALVLPVICRTVDGLPQVDCAPLIDAGAQALPSGDAGRPRRAAVQRVHAALTRTLERWLVAHGEDWLLWRHLPSYFVANAATGGPAGEFGRSTLSAEAGETNRTSNRRDISQAAP